MLCCFEAGNRESGIGNRERRGSRAIGYAPVVPWFSSLSSLMPRCLGRLPQGTLFRFPIPDSRFPAPSRGARR